MNVKELLERCGNQSQIGRKLGVSRHTVRQWIIRNTIPLKYWQGLIELDSSLTNQQIADACIINLKGDIYE